MQLQYTLLPIPICVSWLIISWQVEDNRVRVSKLFWRTEEKALVKQILYAVRTASSTRTVDRNTQLNQRTPLGGELWQSYSLNNSVYGSRLTADKWCVCALQRQDRLGSTSLHLTRTDSYLLTPDSVLMLHSHAAGITAYGIIWVAHEKIPEWFAFWFAGELLFPLSIQQQSFADYAVPSAWPFGAWRRILVNQMKKSELC